MNVFRPPSSSDPNAIGAPDLDVRLQPTPDYGTLGPGSDLVAEGLAPTSSPVRPAARQGSARPMFAIIAAVILAVFVGNIVSLYGYWAKVNGMRSLPRVLGSVAVGDHRGAEFERPARAAIRN